MRGGVGTVRAALRRGLRTFLADSGLEQLDIRWRFRLVVLAFGMPFLAYIVWSASQQALLEKEHIRDRARANATLVSTRFGDHIDQVDRLLATLAQTIGLNPGDVETSAALIDSMRPYVPKSVDNIAVWSLAGDSVTSLDRRSKTLSVNVADRAYFRDAVAKRDLSFEGPMRSRTTGAQIVQFARPIIDADNDVVGVLSMSIRSDRLIGQLVPAGLLAEDTLVAIVDRSGTVVARSAEPELYVGKPAANLEALKAAFAERLGTREVQGVDGQTRLLGYSVVPGRPWLVTVGEPIEQVVGPVSERLLRNLGIGLAIFGLALAIAGRVASWTTKPLTQLAADTERLGGGELSYRSSVETGGEIATLAANFNRMATALEQREIALAASRTQLRAIADNIPQQITYVDRDERYRFVNAFPGPFFNMSPAEMIGRTVREVRGDEIYRLIEPAFRRALAGEAHTAEKSLVVDGAVSHFSVTYVPDLGADGDIRGVYAFAQDITERKTAELLRIESEKRLVTITDNVPAMICYVDENRRFRFANRAFEKWFRRPLSEIIGEPFDRMMAPEIATQYDYYFLRGLRGETLDFELQIPSTDDGPHWLKCSFIPDIDEATGKTRGVYGMIHNVTKAKLSEQRLTRLAQFDTLTGLANRHQFNEVLARALDENDRDRSPLALMFLDIDHFKQVNDRFGHGGGDLLLEEFAHRLADCVRSTDAVARLSGDEFVVLLEGLHSDDEPQFIARKIIAAVEKPFRLDEHFVQVTASIGIAMRARAGEPASMLMKRADEALYEAKRSGRNTFRLAS